MSSTTLHRKIIASPTTGATDLSTKGDGGAITELSSLSHTIMVEDDDDDPFPSLNNQ
jgi:hypothetical protein